MEGKSVILNVLIVSLVLAQIQVEATICCPNKEARTAYNLCRFRGSSAVLCVIRAGCKLFDEPNCPSDFPKDNLQILGGAVNEYCKLGCESSVCGALTTLKNSGGASEIMSGAVEQCTKSCSILCSKGSIQPALES